jgi:hypothetical protein
MKLLTYPYSQTYVPSMPVIELGVSQPGRRQPDQTVSAVIDSGADGTLINVLQHLIVTLNGPAGVTEISG